MDKTYLIIMSIRHISFKATHFAVELKKIQLHLISIENT